MELYIQVISILFVFLITFIFFKSVSPKTNSLLFSRKAGVGWQEILNKSLGGYLSIASIFGTVTSLATVYVFFIGSSKIFGWVTFICSLSLIIGAFVSNYYSRLISNTPKVKNILLQDLPTGSLVTALFWDNDKSSQITALGAQLVSMVSIAGIIWLEFSIFGDLSALMMKLDIYKSSILVFILTSFVCWFTLTYGLQGFVLADILHASLIAISCLMLFFGAIAIIPSESITTTAITAIFTPLADTKTLIVFSLHVIFLNSFLVLTAESHWLRMWLFAGKETNQEITKQLPAQLLTAGTWGLLICIGLISSSVTTKVELEAISPMIEKLMSLSPIFLGFFWLGAIAALFSTTDILLYCFTLLKRYNWKTGSIPENAERVSSPIFSSICIAVLFSLSYFLVRFIHVPIEKLVFTLVPIALNLTPNLMQIAYGEKATPGPLLISLVLYGTSAMVGFLQPSNSLIATLVSALSPAVVSCFVVVAIKRNGKIA